MDLWPDALAAAGPAGVYAGGGFTIAGGKPSANIALWHVRHTITATAGPGGATAPSGAVTVDHGSNQTFVITPDIGHHVADVLADGASVGAVTSYTFPNVTGDHTIAASFAIDTHTLSVTVAGHGRVRRSPDQPQYDYGTTVALTATPAPGWLFCGWSGDASGGAPAVTVLMDGDKNVTATFCLVVDFDFDPHELKRRSRDRWVTGTIEPPSPYGASQIDVASIRLNDIVPVAPGQPAKLEKHGRRLTVKFARADVLRTLSPGRHVPVTISGVIAGVRFLGRDYIRVEGPSRREP